MGPLGIDSRDRASSEVMACSCEQGMNESERV
jgi:hypothetical protein